MNTFLKKNYLVALGSTVTFNGAAYSSRMEFQNHLASPIMVSQSQIYNIDGTETDFSLGYAVKSNSNKTEEKSTATSDVSTDIFAGSIFSLGTTGIRSGMTAIFRSQNQKIDYRDTVDGTELILTPQAALRMGPLVVAGALDIIQKSAILLDESQLVADYFRFRPGIAYVHDKLEVGMVYVNPTRKDASNTLRIEEPARVTFHGRYAITSEVFVGGIVTNSNYKAIDEKNFRDQMNVKGTVEYRANNIKLEGTVGYEKAYYKDKEKNMTEETIGQTSLSAGADYPLNKKASLGAATKLGFGSDSNSTLKVAYNTMSVALRGNVKF